MTQIQLIEPPRPPLQPRPTIDADYVIRDAAKALLPHVMRWLRQVNNDSDDGEVLDDLIQMLDEEGAIGDGYEMAEYLKHNLHWEVNGELVEILSNYGEWALCSAHTAAVKEWQGAFRLQPALPIGTKVRVKYVREMLDGEITAINNVEAKYTVFIPALGHVREGVGTHGALYEFEKVEEWNPEAKAQR